MSNELEQSAPSHEVFRRFLCLNLDRIPSVINAEAVSVEKATFLATHVPMTNIAVDRSPERIDRVNEEQLLAALQEAARKDQHALMVVKGVQGTGKSHLIRWLKERYEAEQHLARSKVRNDVVLLIERSSASLRGTLAQLLESGVFDEVTSVEQLRRLRTAAVTLDDARLDTVLVNKLQEEALEGTMPDGSPVPRRIHKHVEPFLLDIDVRRQLMLPGGPIDRIRQFLTEGRGGGISLDDAPEFIAADLEFPIGVRREISKQGHPGAKTLADDLFQSDAMREHMARFLNALLPAAIRRSTLLSGDDLKTIFFDLRRRLHQEKRSLVLFIEDVTSFTGIDAALMDVLVTQHTGASNRGLCRMTSVIGVTDSYYADNIPANIKDRVTHQVALSDGGNTTTLTTPRAVAELVGRYLNALRLDSAEIEAWADAGAAPDALPIFCDRCRFRETCHPAFGAVRHGHDEAATPIGLYPFNETALWTMFVHLDSSRVAATPRSLLRSIVQYVLQSHARGIEDGAFPPAPGRLGNEFDIPSLTNILQSRAINVQAGAKAPSIETLVRVWGDRSVDVSIDGEERRVGGLPDAVYTAFGLPVIQGEGMGVVQPSVVSPPVTNPPLVPPAGAQATAIDRGVERITDWRQGKNLQGSNEHATRVATFYRDAISWESYQVPSDLVDERLRAGTIVFEGQASDNRRLDQLLFKRTDEVAYALQALLVLRASHGEGEAAKVGGAIAALSAWRRREEPRIVEFVRRPAAEVPEPMPVVRAAVRANVILASLRGAITASDFDRPVAVLAALIEHSVPGRSSDPSGPEWADELASIKDRFPDSWKGVTELRWNRVKPKQLHAALRASLNLGRAGGSTDRSGFLDAATALDEIGRFLAEDGTLSPFDLVTEGISPTWAVLSDALRLLSNYVGPGLNEGVALLTKERDQLNRMLGDIDAEEVVREISDTLKVLRAYQQPHELTLASRVRPEDIRIARRRLDQIAATSGDARRAAIFAARQPSVTEVRRTIAGIAEFSDFVHAELDRIERDPRYAELNDDTVESEVALTTNAYRRLLDILEGNSGEAHVMEAL